jgi:hypothetical protein
VISTVTRCSVYACDRPVVAQGICDMHYRRMKRHGHLEQTRPNDWGDRRKHPLYQYWKQLRRNNDTLCEEWHKDFWAFANAVGDRPSEHHNIFRPDKTTPTGPGNAAWSESKAGPARDGAHSAKRGEKAEYMREYQRIRRHADPFHDFRLGLRKAHGIEVEDFERMLESQGDVCAICARREHRISTSAGTAYRLSVDHHHLTAMIRGLLCSMCNHAVGYLDDSPYLLLRAIAYLLDPPAVVLGIKHNGKHRARRVERAVSPYQEKHGLSEESVLKCVAILTE